jgi:hypothetical protein
MRREDNTQRLTRVFYRLLLHKMFQSVAAFAMPSSGSRAPTVSEAVFSIVAPESCPRKAIRQKGLLGRLLRALHHSRRQQAQRTLRQYHHLVDTRWRQFNSRPYVGGHGNVAQ